MRRKKEPKPEIGQYRIREVVRRDGHTTYDVEMYDWGWECKQWSYCTSFKTMREAMAFISACRSKQVVSREVVWP